MNIELPERPPELSELESRRAVIRQERRTVEDELRPIEEKIARKQYLNGGDLEETAKKMAAGEIEAAARDHLPEQAEVLRERLNVLCRAEQMAGSKVADARQRYNKAIARSLRPQHRAAVQRIHKALLELELANSEEMAVRATCPGAPIQAFSFPNLGTRGPGGGPLNFWIAAARRAGLLDEDGDLEEAP